MPKPFTSPGGEVRELDQSFFGEARRGRPATPATLKKRRVNLMLDADVAEGLRAVENASALVNSLLREKLGV